jgi:hypothetical protein
MIRPHFHHRLLVLIAFAAIWGPGFAARAEQPPVASQPPAESKSAPAPRAKPQVIYHLPRTSTYAATLHSQAKGQSNVLPIDSTMPISLQMSRAAANAAAGQAQEEPSASPSNAKSTDAPRQNTLKRSKMPAGRPQIRSHPAPKGHGPGNRSGNKSHKK